MQDSFTVKPRERNTNGISFGRIHVSVVFLIPILLAGLGLFLNYRDQYHDNQISGLLRQVQALETKVVRDLDDVGKLKVAAASLYQKVEDHAHSAPPQEWRKAIEKNTESRIRLFAHRELNTLENAWAGRFKEQKEIVKQLERRISVLSESIRLLRQNKQKAN